MAKKDYYEVLGVIKSSSSDEIKKAISPKTKVIFSLTRFDSEMHSFISVDRSASKKAIFLKLFFYIILDLHL